MRKRGKLWQAVPRQCTWQPGNTCAHHGQPAYMQRGRYWCEKAWLDARAVHHVYSARAAEPIPADLDSRVGRLLWRRYENDLLQVCGFITRHL